MWSNQNFILSGCAHSRCYELFNFSLLDPWLPLPGSNSPIPIHIEQTSKTKDEEQIDKAGFLAIYTYFAGGINISGLAITMIHHHVILVFTYILPIHKMTCSVGPPKVHNPLSRALGMFWHSGSLDLRKVHAWFTT